MDSIGNSHITGFFSAMNFNGSASFDTDTIITNGWEDIFVAKYNSTGTVLWATNSGGVGMDETGEDIVVDKAGNSYVTGRIGGTALFGNDTLSLYWTGSLEMFLAKYDNNGMPIWGKQAESRSASGRAITIDKMGNCYVSGYFKDSAYFNSNIIYSVGTSDLLVAKYDNNGNLDWVLQAGGQSFDSPNGIGIDDSGNCYVTGSFADTAFFGAYSIVSTGPYDIFFSKIGGVPVVVKEIINNGNWIIYPNPFSDFALLTFDNSKNEKYTLSLFNIKGQLVLTIGNVTTDKVIIEKDNLTSGLYFFQLRTDTQIRATGKLVLARQ